jgi:hypothetical protein
MPGSCEREPTRVAAMVRKTRRLAMRMIGENVSV